MLPGPIFNVELLTSARRARYFIVRTLYGLVLLFALWVVYQTYESSRRWSPAAADDIHAVAALSAAFFSTFATLQLIAVMVLAPAMVAGAIATERERRTIEYLFASPLSNAEIVLGKLAARLVHVVYLLLVGVPVLALMILLGGIAPEALLLLFVLTVSSLVTVCALAMAVSVWSRRAREAVTKAYMLLFVLLALPPVVESLKSVPGYVGDYAQFVAPVNDQLLAANPFATLILTYAVAAASGAARSMVWQHVWEMLRNQGIATLLFAGAATLAVRRVHLRQRTTTARRRRWRFAHLWRPGVGGNPMLWKEIFAEPAASRLGWIGWIVVALIVVGVVWLSLYVFVTVQTSGASYYRGPANEYISDYALGMGTVLACGALLMVAARAAGSIVSERERDCWTSLVSTPLDPSEIIWAKIAGSAWSMRGALALLLLIWGLGVLLDPAFLLAAVFMLATFLLLTFYAAALGVQFSLRCRTSLRAMGATLAVGLTVGGLYFFCCIPLLMFARSGPGREMMLILTPCIPFLLVLPGMVYVNAEHMGPEQGTMLLAYVLGVFGYLVAACVLARSAIAGFDAASGRTGLRGLSPLSAARSELLAARGRIGPPLSRPRPEPLVVATLVEELAVEAVPCEDTPPAPAQP